MIQNKKHRSYSPVHELLCSLSPHPQSVSTLAKDLEMSPDALGLLAHQIQAQGIHLMWLTSPHSEERFVSIATYDWKDAERRAEKYWAKVYEEDIK